MFRILKKKIISFYFFLFSSSFSLLSATPNTCNKKCGTQYFYFYHISLVVFISDKFSYLLIYENKTRTL